MPFPLTRRAVLALPLAALPLLAGCSGRRRPSAAPFSTPSEPVRGVPESALLAEQQLLDAYTATLARHPQLAALLAVPLGHHREHARVLGATGRAPAAAPSGSAAPVHDDQRAAVRLLLAAEQAAADARAGEAVGDHRHGALLASVGAAEAVHADLLTAGLATL